MIPISKEEFLKLTDDAKWQLLCEALKELQELHLEQEFKDVVEMECRERKFDGED